MPTIMIFAESFLFLGQISTLPLQQSKLRQNKKKMQINFMVEYIVLTPFHWMVTFLDEKFAPRKAVWFSNPSNITLPLCNFCYVQMKTN